MIVVELSKLYVLIYLVNFRQKFSRSELQLEFLKTSMNCSNIAALMGFLHSYEPFKPLCIIISQTHMKMRR